MAVFQFHADDPGKGLDPLSWYRCIHLGAGCLGRLIAELLGCKRTDLLYRRRNRTAHDHPLQRNQKNPIQGALPFVAVRAGLRYRNFQR